MTPLGWPGLPEAMLRVWAPSSGTPGYEWARQAARCGDVREVLALEHAQAAKAASAVLDAA